MNYGTSLEMTKPQPYTKQTDTLHMYNLWVYVFSKQANPKNNLFEQ